MVMRCPNMIWIENECEFFVPVFHLEPEALGYLGNDTVLLHPVIQDHVEP